MASEERFDYIIVGAGSAGAVLAHRLTEDADVSVLLLEAGPMDRSLFIHMPSAFAYPLADDKYNWYYHSEPDPHMDNRAMYCPRGRVLGGSSSINGMAYVRGHALDYENWAKDFGLDGWEYRHCLPYFRRAEDFDQGENAYHGAGGPLHVTTGEMKNPLYGAFVEAGVAAGYPRTEDMNGYCQEGFGPMFRTTKDGWRWSTANGYLRPIMKRSNLTVRTRAFTRRVITAGERAIGVEVEHRGNTTVIQADREVLLCAGAINSPQTLMLSGIGPADHLREQGIDVVADRPGVGQNLQDHLEIYVQYACKQPITLFSALKPWNKAMIGAEWLLKRTGLGATNHFESGGFIRSDAGVEHPNLQYHFLPMAVTYDGKTTQQRHGFQAHVGPMRPESRGSVTLTSADPHQAPRILFNYMSTERDRHEMRQSIRLTREIMAQAPMDDFRAEELSPGPEVTTDAQLDAFVRQHGESAYHPSCTCRMGTADDPDAVVDGEGRVHGVDGLRVVDASIMPRIASGNLNAPTIMIAEKIADVIRGRSSLAEDQPWYTPEAPDECQREGEPERPLQE
ncbi:choline dehydrogenase [Aquisalimonas sp.]|uniref:choline dehydrogenase n=1 Tax=Aquisalimonas sp. TaxID=1872621 RepID=UPI0025C001F6|nr:choline dehydrogenase [Aquisalimonas sp.]